MSQENIHFVKISLIALISLSLFVGVIATNVINFRFLNSPSPERRNKARKTMMIATSILMITSFLGMIFLDNRSTLNKYSSILPTIDFSVIFGLMTIIGVIVGVTRNRDRLKDSSSVKRKEGLILLGSTIIYFEICAFALFLLISL